MNWTAWHCAYANDRAPGAFERVLAQVWNEACEACTEAVIRTSPMGQDAHAGNCQILEVSDAPDR